jgi:hypothetical protein
MNVSAAMTATYYVLHNGSPRGCGRRLPATEAIDAYAQR